MNKPVILAGWGVISGNAQNEFYKFIARNPAPVLLTWKSIGLLDNDHPLYCGRPGAIGQVAANKILQECDYLLVLGAKMDYDQTAYQLDKIAPMAEMKIVMDVDQDELDKFDESWITLDRCLSRQFYNDLNDEFESELWLSYCKKLYNDNPVINPDWWNEEQLNYYCFIDELNRLSRSDDVIAPEMSSFAVTALFQTWKVKQGQQFTYAGALGAMGTGIPAAIGAACATGKRVLCPNGDGAFMLNIQELEVIQRLKLPIKFFILDNGGYMAIKNTQDNYFNGRYVGCNEESGLTLPNIGAICEAFGFKVNYIYSNEMIKPVLDRVMDNDNPSVTILNIPQDFKLVHIVKKTMVDGKPTSGKFEDI
jgi:acetolactate synthase-1/2/3 large subunit